MNNNQYGLGLGYGALRHFQHFFNYIVAVSFIGEGPGESTDLPQVTDKLDPIMLYRVHSAWARFELTTLMVICTDCICSCISNYHTITATTPLINMKWYLRESTPCWSCTKLIILLLWKQLSYLINNMYCGTKISGIIYFTA